jgi:hypothetical protein
LATGQIVDLDLSLLGDGSLVTQSVTYADATGGAAARGTVLSTPASGANSFYGGAISAHNGETSGLVVVIEFPLVS